jgi:hypothetical protein
MYILSAIAVVLQRMHRGILFGKYVFVDYQLVMLPNKFLAVQRATAFNQLL